MAAVIALAMRCRVPMVLEGQASLGKTALVHLFAKHQRKKQNSSNEDKDDVLEVVSNSATTSAQDYFGYYVPTGIISFQFSLRIWNKFTWQPPC